ncbi:AbiH family protein [Fructobacillus ficulneus]|uniref:Bacteriophage abortive infection AbiH n=1 Tax=Fructobacillus ficulneus TaxID=157463 RepID=A0A0K8MKD0_9LACO|nr:AbiH family protein [Fructobacillus ficulneus]GAP00350.1 hypothetical protein FFIC_283670 [Fructobacillus ficulneus]
MSQQLLVLGNGFDLNIGVKSTFKDYFDHRFPYFGDQSDINQSELLENPEYNIWDIIIRYVRAYQGGFGIENWSDLETLLFDILCCDYKNANNPLLKFDLIDKLIEVNQKRDVNQLEPVWTESNNEEYIFRLIIKKATIDHWETFYPITENFYSIGDFNSIIETILLNDLRKLESDFSKYLKNQITNNSKYYFRSRMLLEQLSENANIEDISVLSFNYTNPFKKNNLTNYRLIHGNLDEHNIIFGIDKSSLHEHYTDNTSKILFQSFSKQSRVLKNSFSSTQLKKNHWRLNPKNLKQIIFYGHSLSEADYSYFQALFDSIDLYHSDTELIFYYSIYNRKIANEIESSYKIAIELLLTKYGESFDNKTHGRNLVQKLLLENRLIIKKLD